jgi:hypothetical protein
VTKWVLARNARVIGHEKKLYSEHIKLGVFENINRVDMWHMGSGVGKQAKARLLVWRDAA